MNRSALPLVRGREGRVNRWRHAERRAGLAMQLAAVARAVVGHEPLDHDAVAGEPAVGAPEEGGDGFLALVVEDLDVGQARAVVDADVHELPADPAAARR